MNDRIQQALELPPCDQVGFVVRDMEAALALYEPLFGSLTTMDPGPMTYNYRGSEEECEIKIAFGSSGELEVELIQWVSGGCPHKEFLDAGREGMQHLRFRVEDLDSSVEQAEAIGYQAIWGTRYGEGLAVAYLEREGDPLMIEFFENHHG